MRYCTFIVAVPIAVTYAAPLFVGTLESLQQASIFSQAPTLSEAHALTRSIFKREAFPTPGVLDQLQGIAGGPAAKPAAGGAGNNAKAAGGNNNNARPANGGNNNNARPANGGNNNNNNNNAKTPATGAPAGFGPNAAPKPTTSTTPVAKTPAPPPTQPVENVAAVKPVIPSATVPKTGANTEAKAVTRVGAGQISPTDPIVKASGSKAGTVAQVAKPADGLTPITAAV